MNDELIITTDHVLDAMRQEPTLTDAGFARRGKDLEAGRKTLLGALAEIQMCYDWIAQQDILKIASRGRSSYALKHVVEAAARQVGVSDSYVSNGSFLCAALIAGVPYRRYVGAPNAVVGIKLSRKGHLDYKPFPSGYTRPVDWLAQAA